MARPKKGTKGAEEAVLKWRETMQREYGGAAGVHNMMCIIGSKGGSVTGVKKGFASNPALARIAGAKGGRISRRGPSNNTQKLINDNYTKITLMVMDNYSVKDIAKETGIPIHALYKFIREEIRRSDV